MIEHDLTDLPATIDMSSAQIKDLKILHLTTANQARGIADYTRDMITALTSHGIQSEIYPIDQQNLGKMSSQGIKKSLVDCWKKAQAADVIHIQHEFSFFSKVSLRRSIAVFHQLLQQLSKIKKPVVVTFHTEADFFSVHQYNYLLEMIQFFPFTVILTGLLRTLRVLATTASRRLDNPDLKPGNFLNQIDAYQLKRQWNKKINTLFNKNSHFHAIVHTQQTKLKLAGSGIDENKISIMPIGVPPRDHLASMTLQEGKRTLNYPEDIILLSIFGFITENKGHEFAIKALEFLPEHYHLAIIGGPHPEGKNSNLEKILALSNDNPAFKKRIRITGYVDQETADLYHAATDICLAPYHGNMSGSGAIGWALSSGKPIIASKTASFDEINQKLECFLMCAEKSIVELAQQIEYLTANAPLQTHLVKNALKYAADHSWREVVKKTITCYEKCLTHQYEFNSSLSEP